MLLRVPLFECVAEGTLVSGCFAEGTLVGVLLRAPLFGGVSESALVGGVAKGHTCWGCC